MKKPILTGLALILLLIPTTAANVSEKSQPAVGAKVVAKPCPKTPERIYQEADYTVKLNVYFKNPVSLAEKMSPALLPAAADQATRFIGSGCVLKTKSGFYVLTAKHVVNFASNYGVGSSTTGEYLAHFKDGSPSRTLKLIRLSRNTDAAILKFSDPAFQPRVCAAIGKSSLLRPGSRIFIVGSSPLGNFWFSSGYLYTYPGPADASLQQIWEKMGLKWPVVLLTDAFVFGGFSGGPIINERGELVGITVGYHSEGGGVVSVGLPIDDILKEFPDLF